MSITRMYAIAGAFLIGGVSPSLSDSPGTNHGAVQQSIYDVARGEYLRGYEPMLEGRAAATEALPSSSEAQNPRTYEEPAYIRRETRYATE